jgi:hypothetical protein
MLPASLAGLSSSLLNSLDEVVMADQLLQQ